jgi:hypothetical protein
MTGSTLPTGFADLDAKELYRSLIEDFAVEVEEADKGKKKALLATFVEANLTWADYVAQHPEVAPVEPVREPEPVRAGTAITSDSLNPVEEPRVEIVTQRELPVNTVQKHLIKMTRKNPLFQIYGQTFTEKNPYALVDPATANKILREDGFELARPDEVEEFYK